MAPHDSPGMVGRGRLCVLMTLLAVVGSSYGAGAASLGPDADGGVADAPRAADVEADSVLLHVRVLDNGSAAWRVQYRYRLTDADREAAFESLRAEIRRSPRERERAFADRMRRTVRAAANDTGREMGLSDVDVSARRQRVPEDVGIVTYEFRWRSFAVVDDGRLRVGDALSGFYLSPATTLRLTWPSSYAPTTITPPPAQRSAHRAVWTGERQFPRDEPRIVLRRAASATDATAATRTATDAPPTETATTTDRGAAVERSTTQGTPGAAGGDDGFPLLLGLGGICLLAATGGSVIAVGRARGSADDGATATPDPASDELLSDAERVLVVLDRNDGRVRQSEIADTCDWSPSKTSKVVSRMADEGDVEVYRLGRENVVTRPGVRLDA